MVVEAVADLIKVIKDLDSEVGDDFPMNKNIPNTTQED